MLKSASIGDIVYYGEYEQDCDLKNGSEPLSWIVLGSYGDNLLLLSEYIIEQKVFDGTYYVDDWDDSDIREWLNNDFLNKSFSIAEKSMIQKMITSYTTEDMVFLLSAEEVRGFFYSDSSRVAYTSVCAKCWNDYTCEWWTRSAGSQRDSVIFVGRDGKVESAGETPGYGLGIRPAISINISGNTVSEAQNMIIFGYDSNHSLDNEPKTYSSASSAKKKCAVCNGTGYVKYYYGSSDLEAWLSGHDPYTVGVCTSCDGTGEE